MKASILDFLYRDGDRIISIALYFLVVDIPVDIYTNNPSYLRGTYRPALLVPSETSVFAR